MNQLLTHLSFFRSVLPGLALVFFGLLMLSACTDEAEPTSDAEPASTVMPADGMASTELAVTGRDMYTTYCASCHGPEARGDGPVAPLLTVPPPDLTEIRMRRDGNFPVDDLYRMIDGREDVQAHGTREMPIWGNNWREIDGVSQSEEAIEQRINLLIEYLRSIQTDEEG